MPTVPGVKSESLNPKQTLEKVTGLITELGLDEDTPETVPAPETPPEPPPESSDTEAPETTDERYEVKVDGEPVVVDLEELKNGYSRDADYRKKTMALADERRAFETESQAVAQERQQYQAGLAQLRSALERIQGEPDWEQLRSQMEPAEFLKQKADWEAQKAALEKLKRHEEETNRKAQEEQAKTYQQTLRAEQDKLLQAIPEWAEPETFKAAQAKLVQTGKQYGYTEQEVRSVVDHRAIRLLHDAMKYRELHREPTPATKAKVSSIRTAKPGTPERPRPNARQDKLIEQAAKTHRSRDAQSAIEALLPD